MIINSAFQGIIILKRVLDNARRAGWGRRATLARAWVFGTTNSFVGGSWDAQPLATVPARKMRRFTTKVMGNDKTVDQSTQILG